MTKWYGSINNRLDENHMFCNEIKVGTGMTEYGWSDRYPYEVVEVTDQKHIKVRPLDHKHVGEAFTNNWELISNENNPVYDMVKRGKYWYYQTTITADLLNDTDIETILFLCQNNINKDELREKGMIIRRHRANVSFGKAEYYYDYEF